MHPFDGVDVEVVEDEVVCDVVVDKVIEVFEVVVVDEVDVVVEDETGMVVVVDVEVVVVGLAVVVVDVVDVIVDVGGFVVVAVVVVEVNGICTPLTVKLNDETENDPDETVLVVNASVPNCSASR